jgi:serine-type D-Ala-D-Ala carboxypeptidase (penicillin-binding protein 5/6)
MKRFIVFISALALTFSMTSFKAEAKEAAPSVSADSVVLMDAQTGTVLYSKNMNDAYPPASTTKVMTALLTLEKAKLTDTVKVSQKVPYVDGSKIGLFADEEMSVKDVLYGLLLLSGNDCAEALGEHISGSIDSFAKLMTERAKELGCENTNFVNPSGLYDPNHKTSAKDLALIMREAAKYPEFREIASTISYKTAATNKHPQGINLGNENKLINKASMYYVQGAEAGKTGYTVQSQHSYVASASRGNQRLIVALVHDKNKTFFPDAKNLLNYGFNNFELVKLYSKGDTVETYTEEDMSIPLIASEDYYYVKDKSIEESPKLDLVKTSLKDKAFKQGDEIMEASFSYDGKVLPGLKLKSGVDHEIKGFFKAPSLPEEEQQKFNTVMLLSITTIPLFISAAILNKFKRRQNNFRRYK